ncbi:MAG TPA: acyl-CoA thioesterase domain-containing protein, partial [Burkholderiales bacterium]|nr:acyl-CoA thioesterase domain-containing protein [Burkholderiales bacterium]
MSAFSEATAVAKVGDHYSAILDPEWFIWGPFGGYLAALAMRAMGMHSAHRRPATFSCQYLNVGEAGPVDIEVVTRKSGWRADCLSTRIMQGGKALVEAQSWIVADGMTGLNHDDARMPEIKAARDLPPWDGFTNDEERLPIWKYIERRPENRSQGPGHAPGKPEWFCWLRLSQSVPAGDFVLQAARAVLWMDLAPWNTVLVAHPWPTTHIAPTLDLTVQFQSHLYA